MDRIRGRRAFAALRHGRRVRGRWCTLIVGARAPRAAVAFAISRRVGTAVVRNRLRRRLRAVVEECERSGGVPARHYLVIVHPDAAAADPAALRSELRRRFADASAQG